MIQLYWSPRSRSFSALWLMEETGQPYERVLTDISTGAQKAPEYLAINPMGKVPALKDGDAALGEAAAICAYIADRYPEAKLAPPLGDPQRAKYLLLAVLRRRAASSPRWCRLATKLEVNPVEHAGWGDAQHRSSTCSTRRLQKGPWILGDQFSAADIVIGSALNFAVRLFKMVAVAAVVRRLYRRAAWPARRSSAPEKIAAG